MTMPLHVLTGFLGSGKTTLLQKLLTDPDMHDSAVLINEFGEVGIDHLLVEEVAPDAVLLASGCVCCSVSGELKEALINLLERRRRGDIPPFNRVILETTGLANPAPVLATLQRDPQLRGRFSFGITVTLVDALNAAVQERLHPEWTAQVAMADRLVLSKLDLTDAQTIDILRSRLQQLAPGIPQLSTAELQRPATLLFDAEHAQQGIQGEILSWRLHVRDDVTANHSSDVQTCHIDIDQPLDWTGFGVWLSLLLNCHGERILRVKGLLGVGPQRRPIAVHGVQHHLHPPQHLDDWPADSHQRSRLVFILRGLDPQQLCRSFHIFSTRLQNDAQEGGQCL